MSILRRQEAAKLLGSASSLNVARRRAALDQALELVAASEAKVVNNVRYILVAGESEARVAAEALVDALAANFGFDACCSGLSA
jgi:hypothetical protein